MAVKGFEFRDGQLEAVYTPDGRIVPYDDPTGQSAFRLGYFPMRNSVLLHFTAGILHFPQDSLVLFSNIRAGTSVFQ